MSGAFYRNASKLRRQLGTDDRKIIDCTGAKQILLQKLAAMRQGMASEDPRYLDPEYSPYSPEEAERVMANVRERLQHSVEELEARWNVRFVSRTDD